MEEMLAQQPQQRQCSDVFSGSGQGGRLDRRGFCALENSGDNKKVLQSIFGTYFAKQITTRLLHVLRAVTYIIDRND